MWLVGPGDGYPSGARAVDFPQDMSSRGEWAKEDIIKYIKSVVYSDRSMRRWKEGDKQLVVDILFDRAHGM